MGAWSERGGSALSEEIFKTRWLLGPLTFIGGLATLVLNAPQSAFANCVTARPSLTRVSFTCAQDTVTRFGINTINGPGSTDSDTQLVRGPNLDAAINAGVTVSGSGLRFSVSSFGSDASTFINNGAVTTNISNGPALEYTNSSLTSIIYTGNGSAKALNNVGLDILSFGAVQVGSITTPVVPNFSGGIAGLSVTGGSLTNGNVNVYLSSGTIDGGISFFQNGAGGHGTLSLTNHTKINGGASNVGIAAIGPITINSDADIGDVDRRPFAGISVSKGTGGGSIAVTQSGSIFANFDGIIVSSAGLSGSVTITNDGMISAGRWGISATLDANDPQNLAIRHGGTITTAGGKSAEAGIMASTAGSGDVSVSVTGKVFTSSAANSIGISAAATSGKLTIDIASGATVSAGGTGIVATTTGGNGNDQQSRHRIGCTRSELYGHHECWQWRHDGHDQRQRP